MAFSLLIGLGAALGLGWMALRFPISRRHNLRRHEMRSIDAGLWALGGGILGGRLAYVIIAWPYFASRLLEIPQIWLGGLSGPGAATGAVLAAGVFAGIHNLPRGMLADGLLPLATSLAISAWLACWLGGCAYGPPARWGIPGVDEWGNVEPRLPVQLLGALLALLTFWLLDFAAMTPSSRRPAAFRQPQDARFPPPFLRKLIFRLQNAPPGAIACLTFALLALETAGLSFLRADPAALLFGLRLDTLAWAALGGLSLLALWITFRTSAQPPSLSDYSTI